jgi:polysaccharide export outer membrane protein
MTNSFRFPRHLSLALSLLLTTALALVTGCQTSGPPISAAALEQHTSAKDEAIILREGDVVRLAFPGAPNLDDTQQIRRDGKLSLKQVGDIVAAGKTLSDLEKEVLKRYEEQLVVKQVSVTLGSSAYPVFVIGAVLKPGKLMADRPLTVFEAVMEAGGPDFARAKLKEVLLLRENGTGVSTFKFNLKDTLDGRSTSQFYVRPSDVIYVREKFSWF